MSERPPDDADDIELTGGAALLWQDWHGPRAGPDAVDVTTDAAKARMLELQREHGSIFLELSGWVKTAWSKVRVLQTLIERRAGVTYDTLEQRTNISRRNVRKNVKQLVDMGAVEKGGNPTIVHWSDEDLRYVAAEVLDLY